MMDAGFWLGVATPFAVLILFGVTRLLLRAMSALMRLLNRKVHDRFTRRYVFHDEIGANRNVNHERNARELAEVFRTIADIIEQKILPADWRCVDAESEENGAQPDRNPA